MNKAELIAAVEAKGVDKKEAAKAVTAIFESITEALAQKTPEKVQIIGFGTFEVRDRAAKQGRNPKTGETIEIKASKSPAFKAGKALKDSVNK
ncbi:MAG: HU family DNA-binding protein [Clostridiales bacterium]|nr:HU family DNA-binding protein [Clostridiales bacterium]